MGILKSGELPYQYQAHKIPFKMDNNDPVGFSSILFSQAMFVLKAEINRQTGSDNDFYKYTNQNLNKVLINPDPSGFNLGFTGNAPAETHFVDYISDMRGCLRNILFNLVGDSDYLTDDISGDYFKNLYPSSIHNNKTGFTHVLELPTGLILITNTGILGGSGVIYDIDFGEVMYQPYVRMGESQADTPKEPFADFTTIVSAPIFPSFQATDGSLVATNSRDNNIYNPEGRINYGHVQSGYVRIDGDVLISGLTIFKIGKAGEPLDNFGSYVTSGNRPLGISEFGHYSECFVQPVPQETGVYRVGVVNSGNQYIGISSGDISVWPRSVDYNKDGRPQHNSTTKLKGYHVFNDSIWINDTDSFLGFVEFSSGLLLMSPFNGESLWIRFADLTESSNGSSWERHIGLIRTGPDQIYRVRENGTGSGTVIDVHFMKYNDNLDFLGETIVPSESAGSHIYIMSDIFFDGTFIYVMEETETNRDVYKYDTSLNFVNSYEGPLAGPITNALRGTSFDGRYFHFGGSGGLQEFVFDDGTNTVTNFGTGKTIDRGPFTVIGTVVDIHDVILVEGAQHINDGIWALIEDIENDFYVVRLTEQSGSFSVEELLSSRFVAGIGPFIDIIHLPIN